MPQQHQLPLSVQIPETAKEALEVWDSHNLVPALEMGGERGPSYEQAIHIATFELVRLAISNKIPLDNPSESSALLDNFLSLIDKAKELDLDARQGAIAKHLCWAYLIAGYRTTVLAHQNLRRILVSRKFPRA